MVVRHTSQRRGQKRGKLVFEDRLREAVAAKSQVGHQTWRVGMETPREHSTGTIRRNT